MTLSPEELSAFGSLLQNTLSSDNVTRKNAETAYNQTKDQDPNKLVMALLTGITQYSGIDLKIQAAVLLRQAVNSERAKGFLLPHCSQVRKCIS